MGLSKSKAPKPGQQTGFPNQQGFSSTPQMTNNQSPFGGNGFPGQPNPFGTTTPGFGSGAANFGQPPAPGGGPTQGFGPAPPHQATAGFGNQMGGFPPFPPQPQQLTGGFPPSSLFPNPLGPPPPLGPSSAYPVTYQNQSYAPAPGNERRGGMPPQEHHHHHPEQGELSNRFFNDQMHQMPMGQMHKSRKQ